MRPVSPDCGAVGVGQGRTGILCGFDFQPNLAPSATPKRARRASLGPAAPIPKPRRQSGEAMILIIVDSARSVEGVWLVVWFFGSGLPLPDYFSQKGLFASGPSVVLAC